MWMGPQEGHNGPEPSLQKVRKVPCKSGVSIIDGEMEKGEGWKCFPLAMFHIDEGTWAVDHKRKEESGGTKLGRDGKWPRRQPVYAALFWVFLPSPTFTRLPLKNRRNIELVVKRILICIHKSSVMHHLH